MERFYDTVIIGGGPAGAACGTSLQKRGIKSCIIDRAVFPRNKTCAGLVTGKTYRLIDELFDGKADSGLFCAESGEVRLYRRREEFVAAPVTHPVRLVNRREFDNALIGLFKAKGGKLMEGESGITADYKHNTIKLRDGGTVRYGHLIFADGALSMSHKSLNIDKSKLAFGIEAYIPSEKLSINSVNLYFGYLDSGYVWAFPHGDTVCVGAANQYAKSADYRGILYRVLSDMGIEPKTANYVGAFLPYGYVIPQEKLPKNVMLIGDAGGFIDPISGEGLYMSMKTGILAAKAMLSKTAKETYLDSVQPYIRLVKDGKKVQKTFYSSMIQKMFFERVKGNRRVVTYFFDNMVDEYRYDYRQMPKLYKDYKGSRA